MTTRLNDKMRSSRFRIIMALLPCLLVGACASIETSNPPAGDEGVEIHGASSAKTLAWYKLIAVADVGALQNACQGGGEQPFRGFTRYVARGATQTARYVTSRGATSSQVLQPGQRLRAKPVGRRGTIKWYIKQATKPETLRIRMRVKYKGLVAGCYHVPVTRMVRRSILNG